MINSSRFKNEEGRMKNEELSCLLHSTFRILHSSTGGRFAYR